MRRRQFDRIQFFWATVRAAIKVSDWARRAAPVMLLMGALFAGAAVWLTTSTQASHWVWKGWERMFGPSATASAIPGALAKPESSGTSGYSITAIDEPNAGTSTLEGTIVFGVNASGAMTGAYSDQVDVGHGFVCAIGGTSCTSFDAPNAGLSPPSGWFQGTVGIGIDTAGDVAGIYIDSNNAYHGFVREVSTGTITDFDDPNAPTATPSRGTFPSGINDNGQIVGNYTTGSYDTTSLYHGFLYSIANGTFTEIDEPNAGTENAASYQKEGTIPVAINASGVVTGYYVDSSGKRHGFIYSAGSYASFDAPGATTNTGKGGGFTGTLPFGIDSAGDVVGSYTDSSGVRHGFILPAGSTAPTSFDAPGANTTSQSVNFGGTFPTSIDPTGTYVTGIYTDSSGLGHGFVYYLPLTGSGSFTTFTAPNQTTSTSGLPIQGGVFGVNASGTVAGFYVDSNEVLHGFEYTSTATPTPTFSPGQGTYSAGQSVIISDTDSSATIYYTTDGSTPTVNSTQYTGAITVSSTETINAIALDSSSGGYIESAVASATYTINVSTSTPAATPTLSVPSGTYTSAQTVTISDTTSGATIYYTTNGNTPTTSSTVYSGPITVSSSETVEAIAVASGYTNSAVASAAYTINIAANPAPVLSSLSPAFTSSGGSAFTLTITGTGFISGSTAYWGSTALTTTYISGTQLTAQVPSSDIASSGTTAITVQTPSPGGTSNTLEFEVDSGSSGSGPTFTTLTATVAPGSSATYPVALPSSASNVTVVCLNLPAGASCSYSASSGSVTITTSSSTPAGTYQITVVFTETLPGAAAALIFLPILLLPLTCARRRWAAASRVWLLACAAIVLTTAVLITGCGGGSSGSSGGGGTTTPQTHTVTSSGTVTLTVQ